MFNFIKNTYIDSNEILKSKTKYLHQTNILTKLMLLYKNNKID